VPSIGPTELVLVFLIALVVLGPKRLPSVGRQVGRALREFREATSQVRSELGVDEIVNEVNSVRSDLGIDDLGRDLKRDADDISTSLKIEANDLAADTSAPVSPSPAADSDVPVGPDGPDGL
jgi:sec-independent protein translocase protein TatA